MSPAAPIRYAPDAHPPWCPRCTAPRTLWVAEVQTSGEIRDSALYGAVTRYTCRTCGLQWDVLWPDGTVVLG